MAGLTAEVMKMQSPRVLGDMRDFYIQSEGGVSGLAPRMQISSEPAVLQIERGLRSVRDTINFEAILHAVETLEPYVASRTLLHEIANVRPILTAFTDPTARYDSLMNWHLLWTMRWEIIRLVRDRVISGSSNPDVSYLNSTKYMLDALRNNFVVDAFNLNYDDLLEQTHIWDDGFAKEESWSVFDRAAYIRARNDASHLMTHLHGSTRFGYRNEDLEAIRRNGPQRQVVRYADLMAATESLQYPPTPTYTDDVIDDAAPLISGANKVMKFTTAPYSYYFSALQQAAQTNDRLLFLGYGFADPHVNNWILETIHHHGEHCVRAVVVDLKPKDAKESWRLLDNAVFSEVRARLGGSPVNLSNPQVREFVFAGRLGLSGGGYPIRSDIVDAIVHFLMEA